VDALLIAVLAVFVQALSPSKYAGWGVMVLYIILLIFRARARARASALHLRQRPRRAPVRHGRHRHHWQAAWWFRLFWAATAALLLIAVHLLWPRGTEQRLKPRLRRLPARLTGRTGLAPPRRTALFAC
jgi:ABC-2 type transport system permease protein